MRDNAMRHVHLPSGFGVEVALFTADGARVDTNGLVDKCRGADAGSCKVVPGHHSFNGSATSFVHRAFPEEEGAGRRDGPRKTAVNPPGPPAAPPPAPVTNVTFASGK
jgi:hypothetical protein